MEVKYTDAEFKPEDVPVSFELAYVGMRVKRGPDWLKSYGSQGNETNGAITNIIGYSGRGTNIVEVTWDNGHHNFYRAGGSWHYYEEELKNPEKKFCDLAVLNERIELENIMNILRSE